MAYRSVHGSNHPYARGEFGRRYPDHTPAAKHGVSRTAFAATLVAAVVFALWSGATTFYLVFQDDVLHRLALRSETSRSQDAQIAALTTEIERLRSTKFVDQEKIEQQLSELSRIQRMIDARHKALSALAQSVTRNQDITGSIPASLAPQLAPVPASEETKSPPKPKPLSDTFLVDPPLERSASVQSRVNFPRAATFSGGNENRQREISLAARALAKLGAHQSQALNAIELDLDERTARTRKAIAELGPRLPAAVREQQAPVGGPYVPYTGVPEDSFMRQVFRIRLAMAEHERLTKQLDGLPVMLPVSGPAEITSGFGPRVDPFLKRLAMHVGVDIRGESGDPVRASAAGTVVHAERHKAYGLMVEIDHGNGISTRYAHLSAILVKDGAKVPAGAILGKIGSTGRSTAPHLHYEVRLNGDAVDPRRYLRAGKQLAGFQ
jgi:murein DD-endopeptidase MepM/ murein hydrolase activator NlpD